MTKWIALAALLVAPTTQAQTANDGLWFASNLVESCDATVGVIDGRIEEPKPGTEDELAAAIVTTACASYVRGFTEAMFIAGRVEIDGRCTAVPIEASIQEVVSQAIATAKAKPYLVELREPSANLMWAALARLYPCK